MARLIKLIFILILKLFGLWCKSYGFSFIISNFIEINILNVANILYIVQFIIVICIAIYHYDDKEWKEAKW